MSWLDRFRTRPQGQSNRIGETRMGKALEGVKILDFTHVQSGPTCTQLLAWFGADVIKVERPGVGDITRGQLQDVPNADSLYFTMLNHNKRSITIDSKNKKGMEILERLVKHCDVLVENFAPGALDRMGLTWERIQELNPRMIYASVKGFGPGPYEDCKVYENVAQCTGGAASTTGFRDGLPLVTGAQIGDSGTGKTHLATGLGVAACQQKQRVRFVTAAGLVNELVEAQHHNLLGRALARWSRYELIILDEVGYVPFAQVGAELLFQVISERAERATLVLTTNLPFSEWTQVLPNARLCKALLDRVTDRAHIIETGSDSYRFKRTVAGQAKRH